MTRLNVRLDMDEKKDLEELAEKLERTQKSLVREALSDLKEKYSNHF